MHWDCLCEYRTREMSVNKHKLGRKVENFSFEEFLLWKKSKDENKGINRIEWEIVEWIGCRSSFDLFWKMKDECKDSDRKWNVWVSSKIFFHCLLIFANSR